MKLLLAVDSSTASMNAVRETAARTWPAGTTARVVSVVEPLHGWSAPELEEALLCSAKEVVDNAAADLEEAGLQVSTAVLTGDPKAALVVEAAESHADWIVIGSSSTHGVMQFLLGGVARVVAHTAPCSVEIVRRVPGSQPLRILLATDGSESSTSAARSVADRPWPQGACFRILSVVEPSAPLLRPPYFSPKAMEELRGKDIQRAQAAVAVAERIFCAAGIQTSSTVAVPVATPKELILSEAAEWGADMIVVGSHGRRGIDRWLLGSVSEAVALHAPCSVEIVRRPAMITQQ